MEHHIKAAAGLIVSAIRAGRDSQQSTEAVHHARGVVLAVLAAFEGWGAWFLAHIQAINSVMQFGVYAVALITGFVGLRKVLRKSM